MTEFNFNESLKEAEKEYGIGNNKKFKWEEGANRIRVLTHGEPVASHFMGKGQKSITCIGKENGCSYHEGDSEKPTVKFIMHVINRDKGGIQTAYMPYTVVKQIGALQANPDWEFFELPMPYDVTVMVKNVGKTDVEYTVTPSPKMIPLTESEQEAFSKETPVKVIVQKMKDKQRKEMGMEPEDEDHINQLPPKGEEIAEDTTDLSDIKVEDIPF